MLAPGSSGCTVAAGAGCAPSGRSPEVERLHEWRKRVKDLWYHHTLLRALWPPVMQAVGDEAHELSDRLGDDHDLAMLLDWAREHCRGAGGARGGRGGAPRALQAEALALGARLYADKPTAFVRRHRALVGGGSRTAPDSGLDQFDTVRPGFVSKRRRRGWREASLGHWRRPPRWRCRSTLGACGDDDDGSGGGDGGGGGGGTIALLLPETKTTRYEEQDRPNFERRVKELCADCEVIYANANQDPAKQQQQAEAAITQGAKVIVISAVDVASAGAIVERAKQSDVAVIAYGRLIPDAPIDYYVSIDPFKVGQQQAEVQLDAIEKAGGPPTRRS